MLEKALEILNVIKDHSFEAYIVGGFTRDQLLNIKTRDVDITTNASPKQLKTIFPDAVLPKEKYGVVYVPFKGIVFEITTYRSEIKYNTRRKPIKVEYINDINIDLLRRDFTINAICIDYLGKYYDPINGISDLKKKLIRSIGDAHFKINQDPLRILRAIRFATIFDFNIDDDTKEAIINNKHLLSNVSNERKKRELNKIFLSKNAKKGISLLIAFGIDKEIGLSKLNKLVLVNDIVGIWAQLDVLESYPFTKHEKDSIIAINKALEDNLNDPHSLVKYSLYELSIAASIKGISKKEITLRYEKLPIKSIKELKITGDDICNILKIKPSKKIKIIQNKIFNQILDNKLENNHDSIKTYLKTNIDILE